MLRANGGSIGFKDSQGRGFAKFKNRKQTLELLSWQRHSVFCDKQGHLVKASLRKEKLICSNKNKKDKDPWMKNKANVN